ncbi:hypothetical protein [Marinomonas sp.]|uniref:hypothetical protein n=1 Tax=Marinomonas sp. TaxID=1904862 RepID=UPI003A926643
MRGRGPKPTQQTITHSPRAIIKQLDLFSEAPLGRDDSNHANTIALWDIAPLWHLRQPKGNPPRVERTFRVPGTHYHVTVDLRPAHLVLENGETKTLYPTEREMIVEETLRMFAANGDGGVSHDLQYITCDFTLGKLRSALRKEGHDISAQYLRESIEVMQSSSVMFIGDHVGPFGKTNFLPQVSGTDFSQWQRADTKAQLRVSFHPLVAYAIRTNQYRMYDYQVSMSLSNPAARYLYKRFTHYITAATPLQSHEFIITGAQRPDDDDIVGLAEESGYYSYADPKETIKKWRKVADELKAAGLIHSSIDPYVPAENGKPAKLRLAPSRSLVRIIVEANKHSNKLFENSGKQGLLNI